MLFCACPDLVNRQCHFIIRLGLWCHLVSMSKPYKAQDTAMRGGLAPKGVEARSSRMGSCCGGGKALSWSSHIFCPNVMQRGACKGNKHGWKGSKLRSRCGPKLHAANAAPEPLSVDVVRAGAV